MSSYLKNSLKEDCCGCSACVSSCNKSAISMHKDKNGFYYPYVDNKKCISCGRCLDVCSFGRLIINKNFTQKIYAAQNIDYNILLKSSSGGVFFELARKILLEGGVVYGAVYDKNFCVRTVAVKSLEDLSDLMGSKYVQSYIDSFQSIIQYLKKGKYYFLEHLVKSQDV